MSEENESCDYVGLNVALFDTVRKADPKELLSIIQWEHPQIVALILSNLEPNKAACMLQEMPHDLQTDVVQRIATMSDVVKPNTLREIERVLEKRLSYCESYKYTGGVESAVEILNLVNRNAEKQIVEALEDEDPELAEEIKQRMFIFEDIIMLDDRSIQKCMREIDSQELAKALVGVDSEVQNKVFKNMSKRASCMLKEDMEYMGPVRRKDVEEAQQKIVSIVRHLEDIGEIVIARAGEDELLTSTFEENRSSTSDDDELLKRYYYYSDEQIKSLWERFSHDIILTALLITHPSIRRRFLSCVSLLKRLMFKFAIQKERRKLTNAKNVLDAQISIVEFFNRVSLEETDEEESNEESNETESNEEQGENNE